MDWNRIRKVNARRSAARARGERLGAARKARVAAAGGPITLAELKGAVVRTDPPTPGYCASREVWVIRGREWAVWPESDMATWMAYPYLPYRQEPDRREGQPITPAGCKWLCAQFPPSDDPLGLGVAQ
jgi:hypothetical protein